MPACTIPTAMPLRSCLCRVITMRYEACEELSERPCTEQVSLFVVKPPME